MLVQGQHRVVPGDVTKRHMLPLFYGLTLFLAFAVHLAALAGPEAGGRLVCVGLSPGCQNPAVRP